jgi:hypothetical protein
MNKKQSITMLLWALATVALLLAASFSAQAQQGGSLADAARQARSQKQAQPRSDSQAQQFADELAEDQNDSGAPGGFKTFNTGDYKIWVPAPYRLDGHDSAGVVLSGPSMGSNKHPIVLLGTPFMAHFENNDAAFQDTAAQFSRLYAQTTSCTKATVANHNAFECGLSVANLLNQRVTGNAVFVRSLGKIYPVFCVVPSDSGSRDFINGTNNPIQRAWAVQTLKKEEEDTKSILQKCETVFQSIRIPEGISAQKASQELSSSAAGGAAAGNPGQSSAAAASTAGGPSSLSDIAHGMHQAGNAPTTQTPAQPTLAPAQSSIPEGFKAQPFTYCKSQRECWDASVLVPADAQLVSSECKQFVFETKVHGAPFLLLAGQSGNDACANRSKSDASQVHWDELALPESARAPGTYHMISSQQATLDGQPAIITQMGFRKGTTDWMGKRAELEINGVPLVVGCMAPRDHFADGDAICSSLIESLRLP